MLTVLVILCVAAVLFVAASLATSERDVLVDVPRDHADLGLPEGPLVADDVGAVRFGLALRGYRMSEVDVALERLGGALADRDDRIADLEMALAEVLEPAVARAEAELVAAAEAAEAAEAAAEAEEEAEAEAAEEAAEAAAEQPTPAPYDELLASEEEVLPAPPTALEEAAELPALTGPSDVLGQHLVGTRTVVPGTPPVEPEPALQEEPEPEEPEPEEQESLSFGSELPAVPEDEAFPELAFPEVAPAEPVEPGLPEAQDADDADDADEADEAEPPDRAVPPWDLRSERSEPT